jgi:hypothetical protein
MSAPPVKVVAVSDDALRSELLDALMIDDSACDMIFVEPVARAYSRIRELEPDLVLVFMEIDDLGGCQLLSMLQFDQDLRRIRVVACATGAERAATPILRSFDADPRISSQTRDGRRP